MTERASLQVAEFKARELARVVSSRMPSGWGFALVMFSIDQGVNGEMTYVSNLQRADVVKALRELAEKIDRGESEI